VSATVTDHRDRTSAAPQLPQYVTALQIAQRVRLARAAQKRRLATARDGDAARLLAAELVADPPAELATITVRELLLSCRRMGERHVSALLVLARLRGTEQVGDDGLRHGALTPRQRDVLADVLRDVAVREAA